MKESLDTLLEVLRDIHPDFRLLSTDKIEVAEWVRWKCRYGCKAYGKHLNCPPYVPAVEETKRLIRSYRTAIIVKFDAQPTPNVHPSHIHHLLWDAIIKFYDTMYELERHAYLSGYYKAFAMVGLCCAYCDKCISERGRATLDQKPLLLCEHSHKMRPGMEACGIDVFKTVRNAGYAIETLKSPDEPMTFFGLLLIE